MKNNNKTLVYDDACPMCAWYSDAFVKAGILTKEGRIPFSELDSETLHMINYQRSKNEIPLIDENTGRVIYGVDALLELLGQKFPLVKKIGKWAPMNYILKRLYKFISYNRKVIVARKATTGTLECIPDYNVHYRLAFMAFFLMFNTIMLLPIHALLLQKIDSYRLSVMQLELVHTALVALNCTLAVCMGKRKAIEYLGQVNMLALLTILLLVPLMLLNALLKHAGWINPGYLSLLTIFIIWEYHRRMDYAGILHQYQWVKIINLVSVAAFLASLFIL